MPVSETLISSSNMDTIKPDSVYPAVITPTTHTIATTNALVWHNLTFFQNKSQKLRTSNPPSYIQKPKLGLWCMEKTPCLLSNCSYSSFSSQALLSHYIKKHVETGEDNDPNFKIKVSQHYNNYFLRNDLPFILETNNDTYYQFYLNSILSVNVPLDNKHEPFSFEVELNALQQWKENKVKNLEKSTQWRKRCYPQPSDLQNKGSQHISTMLFQIWHLIDNFLSKLNHLNASEFDNHQYDSLFDKLSNSKWTFGLLLCYLLHYIPTLRSHILQQIFSKFTSDVTLPTVNVMWWLLLKDSLAISLEKYGKLQRTIALLFDRTLKLTFLNGFMPPLSLLKLEQKRANEKLKAFLKLKHGHWMPVPESDHISPYKLDGHGVLLNFTRIFHLVVYSALKFTSIQNTWSLTSPNTVVVKITCDGFKLGNQASVMVACQFVSGLGLLPQHVNNVCILGIFSSMESKLLYQNVFQDFALMFPSSITSAGYSFNLNYMECSDLASRIYSSPDEDVELRKHFCCTCDVHFENRLSCGRLYENRSSWLWGPSPPWRFMFCSLHADMRCTVMLCRATAHIAILSDGIETT